MNSPAIRRKFHVKLEKVTLTSKTKLIEHGSLAHQRNLASEYIVPAVEVWGDKIETLFVKP
jgi:hypothetical protein